MLRDNRSISEIKTARVRTRRRRTRCRRTRLRRRAWARRRRRAHSGRADIPPVVTCRRARRAQYNWMTKKPLPGPQRSGDDRDIATTTAPRTWLTPRATATTPRAVPSPLRATSDDASSARCSSSSLSPPSTSITTVCCDNTRCASAKQALHGRVTHVWIASMSVSASGRRVGSHRDDAAAAVDLASTEAVRLPMASPHRRRATPNRCI